MEIKFTPRKCLGKFTPRNEQLKRVWSWEWAVRERERDSNITPIF